MSIDICNEYCRRAQEYIMAKNYSKAILELRYAIDLHPNNEQAHALLGMSYLQQDLLTMAKIHINKALAINPKYENAIKARQMLNKTLLAKRNTTSNNNNCISIFGIKFGNSAKAA